MANHGRLPDEEWLHLAQRCKVGEQSRHFHLRESRSNLIVGNKDDRWWAYCQACKRGAVLPKSHVLLVAREPERSRDLSLPVDMRPIKDLAGYQQEFVASFLASKQMDMMYMPDGTCWSSDRQRLMVPSRHHFHRGTAFGPRSTPTEWMGRDTSGRSAQKWLTYNGQHYLGGDDNGGGMALLVEDAFSWLKVRWALRGSNTSVYCTLGTAIHDSLFLELLKHHTHVVSFYDGDQPGWNGASANQIRLSAAGIGHPEHPAYQCAPQPLDPKDMAIDDIKTHVEMLYSQI